MSGAARKLGGATEEEEGGPATPESARTISHLEVAAGLAAAGAKAGTAVTPLANRIREIATSPRMGARQSIASPQT